MCIRERECVSAVRVCWGVVRMCVCVCSCEREREREEKERESACKSLFITRDYD